MLPPILRDIPEEFETERLLIRAPRAGDGPEVCRAIRESLAELRPWMLWASEDPQESLVEENLRRARIGFLERSDLRLLVFLKGTETLVASSGLHNIVWEIPSFDVGYWCRTPFSGRGYVTEAVRGITAFAFELLEARRVSIRCDADNHRSRAVAERVGFRHEGTLRQSELGVDGLPADTHYFSLLPHEYRSLGLRQSLRAVGPAGWEEPGAPGGKTPGQPL
ncbi:MAG: GNAT family N-acetyltransferase [Armatimonadota bacterium]